MKVAEVLLVKGLTAGQSDAYAYLYDHYASMLYGIILKIVKDPNESENLLQDTFIKIYRHIHSYDPLKGTLATWLINIARNTAIDFHRSSHYKNSRQNQKADSLVNQENEPGLAGLNPDAIGIRELLGQLTLEQQQIIDWIYFHGMTHQEISDQFGIALGTVKTRARNALLKLRKIFQASEINQ